MAFFGLFGPPEVNKLKARGDVQGLITALDYEKGHPMQISNVRMGAAEALGEIGDTRAVDPLIARLKHNDWGMRLSAAKALGKIGNALAVIPLVATLEDANKNVRRTVVEALDKLGWKPDLNENGARYWIIKEDWKMCATVGNPAVIQLTSILKNGNLTEQKDASYALGEIGNINAVEPLIAALINEAGVRVEGSRIADALIKIGTPAVEPLIATLYDTDSHRNEHVIRDNTDWDKRERIVYVLAKIGAPAINPLIAAMIDGKLYGAAEMFGKFGDANTSEFLIPLLKDENLHVRRIAAKTLWQMGWKPSHDEDGAQYYLLNYCWYHDDWSDLIAIGIPAVEPLIVALKDQDPYLRSGAAEALGKIGDARAVCPLITALNDEDLFVRRHAAYALGLIGDMRAIDPLITAAYSGDGRDSRAVALDALKKLGVDDKDAITLYKHPVYSKTYHLNKINNTDAQLALDRLLEEMEKKSAVLIKYFQNTIAIFIVTHKFMHITTMPSYFSLHIYRTFEMDMLSSFQKISKNVKIDYDGVDIKIEKVSEVEDLIRLNL